MGRERSLAPWEDAKAGQARGRDIEIIDSELRRVAALRRAARECGAPLPAMGVADALLDERRNMSESAQGI